MDLIMILIFLGLIATGVIIGYPIGHIFGRRSVWQEFEEFEERSEILNAEVIQ